MNDSLHSAIKVVRNNVPHCYETSQGLDFLNAARALRYALRNQRSLTSFLVMLYGMKEIPADKFDNLVRQRLENTGEVAGAFVMDFDKMQISALHIMAGWKTFRMRDVSSAIYFADLKSSLDDYSRWPRFLDHLTGKELSTHPLPYLAGSQRIQKEKISFAEDVIQKNGHLNTGKSLDELRSEYPDELESESEYTGISM